MYLFSHAFTLFFSRGIFSLLFILLLGCVLHYRLQYVHGGSCSVVFFITFRVCESRLEFSPCRIKNITVSQFYICFSGCMCMSNAHFSPSFFPTYTRYLSSLCSVGNDFSSVGRAGYTRYCRILKRGDSTQTVAQPARPVPLSPFLKLIQVNCE